jgi:hypothetical protein
MFLKNWFYILERGCNPNKMTEKKRGPLLLLSSLYVTVVLRKATEIKKIENRICLDVSIIEKLRTEA